jgi:type I restriction-modification system DNA methylase subunit
MSGMEAFREKLESLILKFEKDRAHYCSKGYPEAQVRLDFINPLFKALGWDIENKSGKPPHERDVLVELSPETTGRPDYNFRINGQTKFFVEAKAPSVALDDVKHILQAKTYAWSTKEVYFVILTDFEEFRLYDASLKPNPRFPDEGLIFDFKYSDYPDNTEKLWELSRERVLEGSLEALLPRDTKSKRLRIPPDKSFLEDLTGWRTGLAKDVHKRNPGFDVKLLNDVVQKLLDRIIFIRIAEDRKTRPERELWEIAAQWREEGKRKSIMTHLIDLFHAVNEDLNGDIFKPHACERADVDSNLLAEIIENLYFPKSRYRFDAIGVELLGSIYERYLGSTIRVTPQRVKVEEKPEVRRAGGVYYTPKYIVDYIVKNTVGKLIEGKTPKHIEGIRILDPACGSGSFLLGAYRYLIDYHLRWYMEHPKEFRKLEGMPLLYYKRMPEDFSLPIQEKAKILRNNIFGVDIDPQAVEITMMSLYLKALEGERGLLPRKQHLLPPLSENIKCGNSLIGYDIFGDLFSAVIPASEARRESFLKRDSGQAGMTALPDKTNQSKKQGGPSNPPIPPLLKGGKGGFDDETRSRINPFDWRSKSVGFGEIIEHGGFDCVIGNPPYVVIGSDLYQKEVIDYLNRFAVAQYKTDLFHLFIQRGIDLLSENGRFGYIVPNTWLTLKFTEKLRKYILDVTTVSELVLLEHRVFPEATVHTALLFLEKGKAGTKHKVRVKKPSQVTDVNDLEAVPVFKISQKFWYGKDGYCFETRLIGDAGALASRLITKFPRLDSVTRASLGCQAYNRSKHTPEQITKRIFHASYKIGKDYLPELTGSDVSRYLITRTKGGWIKYGPWLHDYRTIDWLQGPRILIREIAGKEPYRIHACYVEETYCHYKTILNVNPSHATTFSMKYLTGILNSRLMSFLYPFVSNKMVARSFPRLTVGDVKHLPIRPIDFSNPKDKESHDRLVSLVERMLDLHKRKSSMPPSSERDKIEREIGITDEKIDEIVYTLYGITEKERKIIEAG